MTRFQRGETMEGWNDCPVPAAASKPGSAAKSRKRLSSLYTNPTPASSKTAMKMPPIPPQAAPGPRLPGPPQAPPKKTPNTDDLHDSGCAESGGDATETEHASEHTEEELRDLCQRPELSEADRGFFDKRLVEPYLALSAEHQKFIGTIVQGLRAKEKTAQLKAQILNYMMVHNGVSTWCVPLKKLVEVS